MRAAERRRHGERRPCLCWRRSRDPAEHSSFAANHAFHRRRRHEDADLVVRWAELLATFAGRTVANPGKRVRPTVECCHDVGAVAGIIRGKSTSARQDQNTQPTQPHHHDRSPPFALPADPQRRHASRIARVTPVGHTSARTAGLRRVCLGTAEMPLKRFASDAFSVEQRRCPRSASAHFTANLRKEHITAP